MAEELNKSGVGGETAEQGRRITDAGVAWLLALICVPILSPQILSGDYFWHMVTGRYILDHGQLPDHDIFQAISDGRSWATFQWLYDVFLAASDGIIGTGGIRLVHGVLGATALAMWSLHISRRLVPEQRKVSVQLLVLMAGLFLFVYADRVRIRPHVITYAVTGALLPFLFDPGRARTRWRWCLLPVGLAILANFHAGGALIFLAIYTASVAGACLQAHGDPQVRKRAVFSWLASVIAVCAMPGFLAGIGFGIDSAATNPEVFVEWQPPTIYFSQDFSGPLELIHGFVMGTSGYLITLLLVIAMIWALVRLGIHGVRQMSRLPWVAVAYAAVIISIRSARFVPFVLLALPGLMYLFRELRTAREDRSRSRFWISGQGGRAMVLLGILLMGSAHLYLWRAYGMNKGSFAQGVRAWTFDSIPSQPYPVAVADYLEDRLHIEERAAKPGKQLYLGGIYNDTSPHGSYLLWRLWPHVRVHYDGRGNLGSVKGCDPVKEQSLGVGIPCNEADRIRFVRRHRGKPEFRDAIARIYRESGLRFILVHRPAFALNRPRLGPDEPRVAWPPPRDYVRRVPGLVELWERIDR